MPQLFQVLKCYKCLVFQVHQSKKSTKWECKLCEEKQSIKRHYGIGTGKECRLHVQKLNEIRGEINETNENMRSTVESETCSKVTNAQRLEKKFNKESKWSDFVDESVVPEPGSNESMYLGNAEVVLEVPAKRNKFTVPKIIKNTTALKSDSNYDCTDVIECMKRPIRLENEIFNMPLKVNQTFSETVNLKSNVNSNKFETGEVKSKNKHEEKAIRTFLLPKVNETSKWAQFADEPEEPDCKISDESSNKHIPNNLFSLCDENEIDDVLNF